MKEKIIVLITVDTEAHRGKNPINDWIYGYYKGEEYGINRIMDICEQFNFKATFFLDIAECWTYGDEVIHKIGQRIIERGHDLELHIHPEHFTKDREKLFLWQYTYQEQINIISSCIKKFQELFNKYPIAFRAGKYGSNYDTLEILNQLDIKFDLSMFYQNGWCKLNKPVLAINNPVKYKNLIELPVSVFESFNFLGFKRVDSISLDGCSFLEFRNIISDVVLKKNPRVVVLMLHSFSFIKRDKKYLGDLKGVNWDILKKVEKELRLLVDLKNEGLIEVLTIQDFFRHIKQERIIIKENEEYIPSSGNVIFQYIFTLKRSLGLFGKNKRATLFIILNLIGGILIAAISFICLF